jgi:hypothetical protein
MTAGDASVDPGLFPVEFRLLFRFALVLIRAGCQMCRQQQVLSAHLDELRAPPRDPVDRRPSGAPGSAGKR